MTFSSSSSVSYFSSESDRGNIEKKEWRKSMTRSKISNHIKKKWEIKYTRWYRMNRINVGKNWKRLQPFCVCATVLMLNVISHICSERHVNTFHIFPMSLCDDGIFFSKTYQWRFLYSIVVRWTYFARWFPYSSSYTFITSFFFVITKSVPSA